MFSGGNFIHYIEPFWTMVMVLYVYFIHGKFWGGLTMIATIISISLYFVINLNSTIGKFNEMDFYETLSMGLELSICLSLIGNILHQFIFLKNHAELELRMMNAALLKEKNLVESRDKEKTILLQEIHHRVKNNLQIVMSLLRMQSTKISSPDAKVHFNDAINRVLTMSLIHQKLYQSENLSAVNLPEYIESLASDILRSQVPREIDKTFIIEVQEIGMKTIAPIALIITELISNSVKHAFDKTEHPKIELTVRILEESDQIELTYSDNGTWKESDKNTFGTELIKALTEQLEGNYDLNKSVKGSIYTFQFSKIEYLN
jgi:two-component sensor histidine kinase